MQSKVGKILVVDDDEDVLVAARLLLKQHFKLVHTEKNPERIPLRLKGENYDVILLDMNFTRDTITGEEGFEWLERILRIDPSAVVILITAFGDVDKAVRAIKIGATDFVVKPWQNEKLVATLNAALKLRFSQFQLDEMRSRQKQLSADLDHAYQSFIGTCHEMQRVFDTIEKVAKTDANVLVLGENGTGKELVARAIHRKSLRAEEVFVSVDIGALSEHLFESEMFGYVKGAFTDAKEDRAGRFEVASRGTLFLDEIGNLSLSNQAKLLSTLETRRVTRLGSNVARPVDIRLICATNMPLREKVALREFRQDLLYRINTVEIQLPPLRERKDDIPLLVNHFLQMYLKKYNKPLKRVSAATLKKLQRHTWPGNVRELRHAIERATIMSDNRVLQPSDFFLPAPEMFGDGLALESLNLEDVERAVIQKALGKHEGNISRAAEELGLTRTSLYRRLEKYGL
ncbi:MAG: sigma-54-dependent transcriptional regulator [bacterium]